jgi:hypothetical protein
VREGLTLYARALKADRLEQDSELSSVGG